MVFIPPSTEDRFRTAITPQGVGITGLTAGRLAIPALYFFNMEFYRDIQKTPYYFDMDQFRKRAEAGILVDF